MTLIELATNDQKLNAIYRPVIASGDKNSVHVKVTFDTKWDGFAASAVFFTELDPNNIYEQVIANGMCVVPHEVLTEPGVIFIGVRGVNNADGSVKTSTLISYRIKQGAPAGSETSEQPSQTVYQQLLGIIGACSAEIGELEKRTKTIEADMPDALNPVKTVNYKAPDESGNVNIEVSGGGSGGAPMWIYAYGQTYNSLKVITKDGYESDFEVDNLFEISRQRPIFLKAHVINVFAGKNVTGYFGYKGDAQFHGVYYDFDGNRVPATAVISVDASNGIKKVAITDEKWSANSVDSVTPGVENAGKLLYVDAYGNGSFLQLGDGLEIVNGRLCIIGTVTPESAGDLIVADDGDGNVTIVSKGGASITDDGNGNVTIVSTGGVSITDDENGNVVIA